MASQISKYLLAWPGQPERFDPLLGVFPHRLGAVIGAGRSATVALVEAEKKMVLEMAH